MLKEHRKLVLSQELGPELSGYVHSMHYVDRSVHGMFKELEKHDLLANTLVVIYGDHDSKLTFGKSAIDALARDLKIDPLVADAIGRRAFSTKKIPLLFHYPRAVDPAVVAAVGGQIDIGPTILDWLGYDKPTSFIGRVLSDEKTFPGGACPVGEGVIRNDGSAAGSGVLWEQRDEKCIDLESNKELAEDRCFEMRQALGDELDISRDVTLHDLAERLSKSK